MRTWANGSFDPDDRSQLIGSPAVPNVFPTETEGDLYEKD
jgi:hypothetical protein